MNDKRIYFFGKGQADGRADMKDLLGGKGANLAEMTNAGLPVPPGFTIATTVCNVYSANNSALPADFAEEQKHYLSRLEDAMGKKLGDPDDPLLVSVRSGAKFSMPGMMDTVLNLGLNDRSVKGLAKKMGNERFAYDAYRRFIQMFGNVVMDIEKKHFEVELEKLKKSKNVEFDTDLTADDLKALVATFEKVVRDHRGIDFPQDPGTQLDMSRDAVFRSWQNPRAQYYRKQNRIPDDLGTAVNVQAMVFGNMGNDCGTGVGFTRDPATGENAFYGEYLVNAQGEDVVAGIRTPQPIAKLREEMPAVYDELREITNRLEKHYRDIQDFEFTIEKGRLFMLQTRTGKRTGPAAVKIAVDMVKEGLIDRKEAILRVPPNDLDQLLHRRIDPKAKADLLATGLAASPGAACGIAVFSADEAFELGGAQKKPVILIRNETNPDDIHGMDLAQGILTATGGMTSHAAVVTRGMGKPCIVGCSAIRVSEEAREFTAGGRVIKDGEWVTIDGSTGKVYAGRVETIEPTLSGEFEEFISWTDEFRTLKVRANADVPRDAIKAREFGAQGIGLCRTEHMFFGDERIEPVREMILSASEYKRLELLVPRLEKALEKATGDERGKIAKELEAARGEFEMTKTGYLGSLAKLLPFQREDFLGVFKAMDGYPVTIRTLDPPLHEFLPKREELMVEVAVMKATGKTDGLAEKEMLLQRVEALHEFNPMLGHRGCRLGITYPEITAMQVRAIFEAACAVQKAGGRVIPEIMIPLIGTKAEFSHQKKIVVETAESVMKETGVTVEYLVGTMIEVPRAALTADKVAEEAQFFSFGTNDLTQMGFGYSRDDVGKFLGIYVDAKILPEDPFVSIDQEGIGELMKIAVTKGRATRPDIKLGICGEHGGEPSSVGFCHRLGLHYVSCSPYRVPIARLAAAQAALSAGDAVHRTA